MEENKEQRPNWPIILKDQYTAESIESLQLSLRDLRKENQRLNKALKIALNYLEANPRATITISEIKEALNGGK